MRCRDFSRRILTISASCPSISRFCCHVLPICSARLALTSERVSITKRQGCLPCGDGAQRAASIICSMYSRATGRAWYLRTLRLPRNRLARLSARAGRVACRNPDCVAKSYCSLYIRQRNISVAASRNKDRASPWPGMYE
jgi:hypothetical protein